MTDTVDVVLKNSYPGDLYIDDKGRKWQHDRNLNTHIIKELKSGFSLNSCQWGLVSIPGLKPYVEKKEMIGLNAINKLEKKTGIPKTKLQSIGSI